MNHAEQMSGEYYDAYATREQDLLCVISKPNFHYEQREKSLDFVIID